MGVMTIVNNERGFLINTGGFDESKVRDLKSIRGAGYRGNGTWFVPGHREREVNMLKEKYGIMTEPVIQMREQTGVIPPLPELEIDVPLKIEPFKFQKPGIAFGIKNKKIIIGDQQGLGKTLQAIGMAVALECKCILVICPATLKLNWQEEWRNVAGRTSMILSDRVKSSWANYHRVDACHIFIVNYESLLKYFVKAGWTKPKGKFSLKDIPFKEEIDLFDCVIVDESTNCKDGTRLKTKLTLGICKGKPNIFALTGTPVINKPNDLLAQLAVVDRLRDLMEHIPHPVKDGKKSDWSGYNRFLNRYCEGGRGVGNLKELNYRLNALGIFYRREKAEVLKDLPEKMRQIVLCEITNRKEYEVAQRDFIDYLKKWKNCTDEQVQRKLRGEMMVKIGVLKQISARGKIEAAIEHINECIEGGEKIIVFANLKEITGALKQHYNALSIVGDDKMEERQRAIKEFQGNPNQKVIVCSITAAGMGVTLTAATNVLFVEFPWTYANCEQCEDRAHRIGQLSSVLCKYLLGENTIDRYCYELIQKKKSIHKEVTGSKDEIQDEIVDELLNLFNQQ